MKIYLDNAATTFLDERIMRFLRSFKQKLGNASSQHRLGVQAAIVVENARQTIAKSINADARDVYFVSGGTEANNTVMKGIAFARKRHGNHIVVSVIEHPSILEPARWLQKQGFQISYVGVSREGLVDPVDVGRAITKKTILVSIMHANNEIGTIQPVRAIGRLCRQRGVYFHTDACQSFTKVPLDVRRDHLDLVTLNSHKIHGPGGVGALYIRKGVEIDPLMHGGNHENGMRAGTHDTEGIAGFGKAVEIADRRDVVKMLELRDYFIERIETDIEGALLNGSRRKRLCNNVNFSFQGVKAKELFLSLNKKDIYVSTGSACSARELAVSHVLQALNINQDQAKGAVRMSLSKSTTKKDIDRVVKNLKIAVTNIRRKL
jgi:cysteine desulfurase